MVGGSMVRRVGILVALALAAAGCMDSSSSAPAPVVETEPSAEALARLRDTDICALIPPDALAEYGVTAVGTNHLYGCAAVLGGDPQPSGSVDWVVRSLDNTDLDAGETVTIDGAAVTLIGDYHALRPDEIATASQRFCTAYSPLPTGGSIEIRLNVGAGTEPCTAIQPLVGVALSEWKRHPRLGESPGTVRTVVTGADPCEVLTRLPDARGGRTQWVDGCWFDLDGDHIYVGYTHASDREFENYDKVEIAGRQVFATNEDGTAYMVRVGPTFDPVVDGYEFEEVPAVQVRGHDRAAVEKAVTAVLGIFPEAE
ncbi:hypothetical protein [Nocardia sp. CA-290969]|uniref:hypothetical protein n=1 Tax=Nocardia sp. CA-290969 TaxID=3239986 RepID=UPI003D946E8E